MEENSTDYLIKSTIIFDGEIEHNGDDIFSNKHLYSFFNKIIVFSNEINNMLDAVSNGKIIYIKTDKRLREATFDYIDE